MGNGQSSSNTNIPSSNSFLSNKRSDVKTKGKIIVVKQRTNASCSKNDDIMKRFMEIPKFYPILKNSLNHPGLRDPPEAIFKINSRPILKFAYRLQEHLSRCANIVVVKQESLGNSIRDIDHNIALLLIHFGERKRSVDRFQNYLGKISDLQANISNLQFLFQDLMPMAETLNNILPEQKRLPVLDIDFLKNGTECSLGEKRNEIIREIGSGIYSVDNNQDDLHIKPVEEDMVLTTN
ncbi:BLOC-1-related complex subunit [Dirofilaria immitis]